MSTGTKRTAILTAAALVAVASLAGATIVAAGEGDKSPRGPSEHRRL